MRKILKYLLLIIFLIIYSNSYAQWQKMFEVFAALYEFTGNSNYVFCATGPTGIFRSSNSGLTWDTVNSGLINKSVKAITAQGIYIFAATDSGLFRSTNNGNNWISFHSNIYQRPVFYLSSNNQFVFAATLTSFFRSSDFGITWDSINSGLPHTWGFTDVEAISTTNDVVYVGVSTGTNSIPRVYKSYNNGTNWIPIIYNGVDSSTVYSLGVKDSIVLCGNYKGVYISRNSGVSWRRIPEVNPNIGLFGFSIIDERNIFIASYGYGVQVTTNGGLNWVFKNDGINPGEYNSCALYSRGDYTFLGTRPYEYYLPAVFRRNTSQLIPVIDDNIMVPKDIKLFQNYPNPFNNQTKIKFAIPKSSMIRISVFDILGKEMDVILDGIYQAGKYEINYSPKELSSGIYFYKMEINGIITKTKKLVLNK